MVPNKQVFFFKFMLNPKHMNINFFRSDLKDANESANLRS